MALGGHHLVAWSCVTHPVELGGLGVVDLTTMGYALRLGWEWPTQTQPERIWMPTTCKTDIVIQDMFQISTTVRVGNGSQMLFWMDHWSAVDLVAAVRARCRKTRLVSETLQNGRWIANISGALSIQALCQNVFI
jgi:hypothetical protein